MYQEEYQPPVVPVDLPTFTQDIEFGLKAKQAYFFLDEKWTFINHGAFGAVLKPALSVAMAWQLYCERQPLRFLDRELLPLMAHVTRQLAKFIDSDPCDIVLIPNATTGVNAVMHSLSQLYTPHDTVIIFNTTYGQLTSNLYFQGCVCVCVGSVKKLVRRESSDRGFSVQELTLHFPLLSPSKVVDVLDAGLRTHHSVKLVIIDHIASSHAIVFPVKEMVALCHSRGVQVLVDGAHALGSLPISMRDIGADFYVSNAHKWLCNPKGCGFLYVNKSHQDRVRPLLVSHGYDSGFNSSFIWSGLRDYSPFLALLTVATVSVTCVPLSSLYTCAAVLEFWVCQGVDDIRRYIHTTAREAGEALVSAWGTELLDHASLFGPMVLVALPEAVTRERGPHSYQHAEAVQNTLYHQFHIEVPVKAIQGRLYVRVSAHIYNTSQDYATLATAVVDMATTASKDVAQS
jgi:selenocysteine lyase/cysteine desulfurase